MANKEALSERKRNKRRNIRNSSSHLFRVRSNKVSSHGVDELKILRRNVLDESKMLRNKTAPLNAQKSTLKKILNTFADRRQANANEIQGRVRKGKRIGVKKLCNRLLPVKKPQPGIFANGLKGTDICRGNNLQQPNNEMTARIAGDLQKFLDNGEPKSKESGSKTELEKYLRMQINDIDHACNAKNYNTQTENDPHETICMNSQSDGMSAIGHRTFKDRVKEPPVQYKETDAIRTSLEDEKFLNKKRLECNISRHAANIRNVVHDASGSPVDFGGSDASLSTDNSNGCLGSATGLYEDLCLIISKEALDNRFIKILHVDPLDKVRKRLVEFYKKSRQRTHTGYNLYDEKNKTIYNKNLFDRGTVECKTLLVSNCQLADAEVWWGHWDVKKTFGQKNSCLDPNSKSSMCANDRGRNTDDVKRSAYSWDADDDDFKNIKLSPNVSGDVKTGFAERVPISPHTKYAKVPRLLDKAGKQFSRNDCEIFFPCKFPLACQPYQERTKSKVTTSVPIRDSENETARWMPSILRKSNAAKTLRKRKSNTDSGIDFASPERKSSIFNNDRNVVCDRNLSCNAIPEYCHARDKTFTIVSSSNIPDPASPFISQNLPNLQVDHGIKSLHTPSVIRDLYDSHQRVYKAEGDLAIVKYRQNPKIDFTEHATAFRTTRSESRCDRTGAENLLKIVPENYRPRVKHCSVKKARPNHNNNDYNSLKWPTFVGAQKAKSRSAIQHVLQNVRRISLSEEHPKIYPVNLNHRTSSVRNATQHSVRHSTDVTRPRMVIEEDTDRMRRMILSPGHRNEPPDFKKTRFSSPRTMEITSIPLALFPNDSCHCTINSRSPVVENGHNFDEEKNPSLAMRLFDIDSTGICTEPIFRDKNIYRQRKEKPVLFHEIPILNSMFGANSAMELQCNHATGRRRRLEKKVDFILPEDDLQFFSLNGSSQHSASQERRSALY